MKKYKGMTHYYRGSINGQVIESEFQDQLLRLASRIANKQKSNQDILYVNYVAIEDEIETTPLPQEYYVRLSGCKWEYKGAVPKEYIQN